MDMTTHLHPNPIQGRIRLMGSIALIIVMVLASLGLLLLAFTLGAPLFAIMALLVLLLIAPVVMLLVNTPPLIISPEGLRLQTLRGERLIPWQAVVRVRRYPLLPTPEQESGRRLLVGRNRYVPAQGIMLTIPQLPFAYRIAGLLAGENGAPVVVFSNRTHTDYDVLVERIRHFAHAATIHDQE